MKLFNKKEKQQKITAPEETAITEVMENVATGAQVGEEEDDLMATIRKRNPRKKKKIIRVVVIVAIIIVIAVIALLFSNPNNSAGLPLTTTEVMRGDVEQTINSSGMVETENRKVYYADVTAPIAALNLETGSTVEKGAVLLAYDVTDLTLEKEKAVLTASSTKKKLQEQLEDGSKNEIDFAVSAVAVNDYDGRIAELQAKIDEVYCMINSRKKWMADDGARLQNEIAELQQQKITTSDNKVISKINDKIEECEDEINGHGTVELEEYLRQGEQQMSKLQEEKAEYKSTRDSSEQGILSGTEKSQIADDSKLAEVTVEEVTRDLERASKGISAEFGGIVTDVKVTQGAVTSQGTELFTIEDTNNVKVVMKATKYDLETIEVGQSVDITIAGHEYTGAVTKIDRMAQKNESGASVINAEIHIDKPDDFIYLGIEAKVVIHVAEAKNVLLLPVEVVNMDETGYYCYVIYNGMIERRELKIGITSDAYTEILEGIEEGDQVIRDSSIELIPGTPAIAMPEDGE